ncbi:MAG: hypothetical protein KGR26_09705 [Cyanobacteria bacterium REEB65]|nr:hypothetical protein [Cyanobacteria bacterium REEB65]
MASRRLWGPLSLSAAALLVAGCLPEALQYLHLSTDYALPGTYADPQGYWPVMDAWTRESSLGLAGGIAATLEDPAVGRAIITHDALVGHLPDVPGEDARARWDLLYDHGSRLPVRVHWRFDKNLYRQSTADPQGGWTFRLADDQGFVRSPLDMGKVSVQETPRYWKADFTIWFARRSLAGRLLWTSHTRELILHVVGTPGQAELQWRFLPLLDHVNYGLFDQFDSSGAYGARSFPTTASESTQPSARSAGDSPASP